MFTTRVLATSLAALSLAGSVLAHGYTTELVADDKSYPMWAPWTDPYESPVPDRVGRKIANDGPITDLTSGDIACNKLGAAGQKISATVAPGGKVTFKWTNWPADHLGPVTLAMASCNGACADLNLDKSGKTLEWFYIDAKGYDASSKRWASQDLIDAGNTWSATIPTSLAAGEYLIRNEIVALHSLPAQSYPACAQLKVTGSGNAKPASTETFTLPGLYDGYKFPYIWSHFTFAVAGPKVFSSGSSSNPAPASASSSASAAATPTTKAAVASPISSAAATSTATPTAATTTESTPAPTSTRTCRRKNSTAAKREETAPKAEYYKRHGTRRSLNRLASHH